MASADEWEPIRNPFLLDVVLDKLFKYLRLKDIIIQRGVCKLWQEIGLERIQKDIDEFEISFDPTPNSVNSIEKFLEMSKNFSFNFTNVSTYYWNDEVSIRNVQQTNRLFDEYGVHLKVLALNLCGTTNSWKFLSDVLVNKAPNVEQLCLKYSSQAPETTDESLFSGEKKPELKLKRLILFLKDPFHDTTLLTDLFACTPYLEILKVVLNSGVRNLSFNQVSVFLQTLANEGHISNLKELFLNISDLNTFDILATSFKSVSLEKFWIEIFYVDLSLLARIETFFGDHKDTLKSLRITFPCVHFLSRLRFPTMSNLQTLCISDWWCFEESGVHQHRAPFGVFNFGEHFPNLLSLHLFEKSKFDGFRFFNLDKMFPKETTPLPTLKNLGLPHLSKLDMLRRLGRIFPNVVKLNLAPQTPDILQELWTTWPEMKTLQISMMHPSESTTNLDLVFTGVAGSDRTRKFPSISHLKELKHLQIDGGTDMIGGTHLKIKDETARLALAKMKGLVSLYVSPDRHQISPLCVKYLCKELDMFEREAITTAIDLVKYEWQKKQRSSILLDYE